MEAKAMNFASSSAPWRKGASWILVIIEGGVLAALGLYALLAPDGARETVFAVFGALLLVNGAGAALTAFRSDPSKSTSYLAFRGGIGVACGLLALIARFTDVFTSESARVILGSGFLIVGIIGLAHQFLVRDSQGFRLGTLAWNLALIVFSILLFTGSEDNDSRFTLLGWILITMGALLLAFGYYLKMQLDKANVVDVPEEETPPIAEAEFTTASDTTSMDSPAATSNITGGSPTGTP
jgi:uncharacterized membrane protein HdeD (DUF308 family)